VKKVLTIQISARLPLGENKSNNKASGVSGIVNSLAVSSARNKRQIIERLKLRRARFSIPVRSSRLLFLQLFAAMLQLNEMLMNHGDDAQVKIPNSSCNQH
jgi:hypothetical protein